MTDPLDAQERALIDRCLGKQVWGSEEPLWFREDVVAKGLRQAEQAAREKERQRCWGVVNSQALIDDTERQEATVDMRSWNLAVVKCRNALDALKEKP